MSEITIYTDGACSGNPGPGGWGAIILKNENTKDLSGHELNTTNNRMELTAIVQALRYVQNKTNESTIITIYSDSAYAVNAINLGWVNTWKLNGWKTTKSEAVKNVDLWIKLDDLLHKLTNSSKRIIIKKVKGHAGNFFNEHVDKLAKDEVKKIM